MAPEPLGSLSGPALVRRLADAGVCFNRPAVLLPVFSNHPAPQQSVGSIPHLPHPQLLRQLAPAACWLCFRSNPLPALTPHTRLRPPEWARCVSHLQARTNDRSDCRVSHVRLSRAKCCSSPPTRLGKGGRGGGLGRFRLDVVSLSHTSWDVPSAALHDPWLTTVGKVAGGRSRSSEDTELVHRL